MGVMTKRTKIILGQGIGLLCAVLIVALPQSMQAGFLPINAALITAFLPGGLVALAMVGMIATRRLFDDSVIGGGPLHPGSRAATDQRALANTIEQIVLALALWPFVALTLGGLTVIWMGVGFAFARLAYWLGYHVSPLLKSVGFGAGFYPTVLAALWALGVWAF